MRFRHRSLSRFVITTSLVGTLLYIYIFGISDQLSRARVQLYLGKRNLAYATFLAPPSHDHNLSSVSLLGDPYFTSVRLLNYQIKHAEKTKTAMHGVPFLVLVLPNVHASQIAMLEAEGATIVPVEPLALPDAFDKDFIENSRFRDVLSKLRLWQLTDYEKILHLDADSILLQNLDDIFAEPNLSEPKRTLPRNSTQKDGREESVSPPNTYLMAASTDTYGDQSEWEEPGHTNYLCACFFLTAPSTTLFDYYTAILTGPNAPPNAAYPEQDLLIYAHREDGPMPWTRIPIHWSANDGEMNDELALKGGVKSLHIKGWDGAEGGNIANAKYKSLWRDLVREMEEFNARE